MSEFDFTEKTKKEIRMRAGGECEIHTALDRIMDGGDMPEDFPRIDLDNQLHTILEEHHCNFKSTAMPGINQAWNGAYIYRFYHDIIHPKSVKNLKWQKRLADYCRMVAESRRPVKSDEEEQSERISRHAEKIEKNSETRKKNKAMRKKNPWMSDAQRRQLEYKSSKKSAEGKKKKNTKVKIPMYYDKKSGTMKKHRIF